ncbi:MAG: hypothetical protein QN183_08060 [Armatimonadota bacterium]|nr:hypothetical protein [Armatimonadota bacterium]MDR7536302.1 hypothetical protein [Armatimonadota bacterium]
MDWGTIWRTVFCGWDALRDLEADLAALADASAAGAPPTARLWAATQSAAATARPSVQTSVPGDDPGTWVCRQIQQAF